MSLPACCLLHLTSPTRGALRITSHLHSGFILTAACTSVSWTDNIAAAGLPAVHTNLPASLPAWTHSQSLYAWDALPRACLHIRILRTCHLPPLNLGHSYWDILTCLLRHPTLSTLRFCKSCHAAPPTVHLDAVPGLPHIPHNLPTHTTMICLGTIGTGMPPPACHSVPPAHCLCYRLPAATCLPHAFLSGSPACRYLLSACLYRETTWDCLYRL